ncbi:ATP-binding protein, partial [Acinetobacter baumannii]|nr:ATP-binding protein [Acinetobacter baumannii]EJB8493136.1 ATP-binding protein [Acinetobacter baumannii]EJB8500704.1 ATP-binding protein [Acinetobacter baumannii]
EYKAKKGCRGVGRLMWLKAFTNVSVESNFIDSKNEVQKRKFNFNKKNGIYLSSINAIEKTEPLSTTIKLEDFIDKYEKRSPKSCSAIANNILEHCLWYFVREGGAPKITIYDQNEIINLNELFDAQMFESALPESFEVSGIKFELLHIKLKSKTRPPCIAWCAAGRVVKEENLIGKIAGLHGKIQHTKGDFTYCCYLTSTYLDEIVRPERIDFNIDQDETDLYTNAINEVQIREIVYSKITNHLNEFLIQYKELGRQRVHEYVTTKAPRYKSILKYIPNEVFFVNPEISDKELDLLLHKYLTDIESQILSQGHDLIKEVDKEEEDIQSRIVDYMQKVDDVKKSDLAGYVCNRKVVLDILEKAIQRGSDGKYSREDLIHQLIMPMRQTSEDIGLDKCNLWLIDERLAFHDYLASDKTLSSMPITDSTDNKEPDLCALNVYDEPLLISEGKKLPLASLTIVEIKRPMRNDIKSGEDKDPVEQVFGYLRRIRNGKATTATGRPIPDSKDVPGFCYVICDLTPSMNDRCKEIHDLTETSDKMGFFGYKKNLNCYIEVISFDRLVNSAKERNRAFFDKLGLPAN